MPDAPAGWRYMPPEPGPLPHPQQCARAQYWFAPKPSWVERTMLVPQVSAEASPLRAASTLQTHYSHSHLDDPDAGLRTAKTASATRLLPKTATYHHMPVNETALPGMHPFSMLMRSCKLCDKNTYARITFSCSGTQRVPRPLPPCKDCFTSADIASCS